MLSLETAHALFEAGLAWSPARLDFFVIPDRGLDDRVFVLSEMPAMVAQLQGQPVLTFDGAAEWALDYIAAGEALWLPSEAQLRAELAARLESPEGAGEPGLRLEATTGGWRCALRHAGQALSFEAAEASEAYAAALLHLLRQTAP